MAPASERAHRRDEYRAAALAYREAVASAQEFAAVRECLHMVEHTRRRVKLPEDRRRVERELTAG